NARHLAVEMGRRMRCEIGLGAADYESRRDPDDPRQQNKKRRDADRGAHVLGRIRFGLHEILRRRFAALSACSAAQDATRLDACHFPPLRTDVTAHFSPCFFRVMYSSRASGLPPT